MDISVIVDKLKEANGDILVKAILPDGTIINMSTQQYVIDGEYHMFAQADGFDEVYQRQHTTEMFKRNLEYEASDSCWRTQYDIFEDGKSDFLDCEVYIVTGNYDDYHNCLDTGTYAVHETFGAKIEDGVFYLICSEGEVPEDEEDECDVAAACELKVPVPGGHLVARRSFDPNYPGIDVEFVPEVGNDTLSNPRVLIEKPSGESLRAFVWNNAYKEDYTTMISLE